MHFFTFVSGQARHLQADFDLKSDDKSHTLGDGFCAMGRLRAQRKLSERKEAWCQVDVIMFGTETTIN